MGLTLLGWGVGRVWCGVAWRDVTCCSSPVPRSYFRPQRKLGGDAFVKLIKLCIYQCKQMRFHLVKTTP